MEMLILKMIYYLNDSGTLPNNDISHLKRINRLIKSIERDGFSKGLGKPEPLKYDLKRYWSRRINDEHRLIYRIDDGKLVITSCKDQY